MQVTGGNIATYAHWAALGGLGIQAASFLLFCIFLAIFALCVRHRQPQAWRRSDGSFTWSPARLFTRTQTDDWRVVLRCTIAASFFLTIRNIFRVFEYVEGESRIAPRTATTNTGADYVHALICLSSVQASTGPLPPTVRLRSFPRRPSNVD